MLKVSFVIPAHNEERLLGGTLEAMHRAAGEVLGSGEYEVIVVDDSSTDATGEAARRFAERGTRVVRVEHRQISKTRAAGARQAVGEVLVFVDADTTIDAVVLRAAVRAIGRGAVGGGAGVFFEGRVPLWARVMGEMMVRGFRVLRLTGGCFLFCTREAYDRVGGWDETVFAGEEVEMCRSLHRLAGRRRFVILRERVVTSARKLRTYSLWEILSLSARYGVKGKKMLRTREGLDIWYGERREEKRG